MYNKIQFYQLYLLNNEHNVILMASTEPTQKTRIVSFVCVHILMTHISHKSSFPRWRYSAQYEVCTAKYY